MKKILGWLILIGAVLFIYGLLKSNVPPPPPPPAESASNGETLAPPDFQSKLEKFKEIAQEEGVGLIGAVEETPGTVIVSVYGRDNSEISRYLTAIQTEITLQDFDGGPTGVFTDERGRPYMKATFKFKYKIR